MMDENMRDPKEDISMIREILEKTEDNLRTIRPWFTGLGLLWLIYGVFSVVYRYILNSIPLIYASTFSIAYSIVSWIFYLAIFAGFCYFHKKQVSRGMEKLTVKIIDIWGVCIITFLILIILLSFVIPFFAIRQTESSFTEATPLLIACSFCRSFLFFILPALPLLITALFLENRSLFAAGVILSCISAFVLCIHALMMYNSNVHFTDASGIIWFICISILDLSPGVMLLMFSQQLKEE